ncbi:MAG: hypothetical protein A3G34_17460 [Candidatus Lindowbacteria bacterium RIFCSPLOWO2_12_FULL_62_27]|nr:MAG: hypothetical protein A3G34_17460 [Candidatus Lindowbacteria bacterium RIFCSPLOWO2_12_FULL_62_27]
MGARRRIPQEELDRIKRDVSVADLAQRRGVELKPHGKDLIGLCPFHSDHSPSLVITPEKNLWHCLGACQAGGDVIAWVMKAEGVSFTHAVELLRRHDVALSQINPKRPPVALSVKKLPPPIERTADDQTALRQVVEFYHETLKDSPDALAYLERRRIGHAGALDHFKLGYANRTLGYRLPFSAVKEGRDLRDRLRRLGIYRETFREHFCGCVEFPVFDESGAVTEIYGRRIQKTSRDAPEHLYLPGPHKGVWNVSALAASTEVILCEALIDALTFWCAGYRNVTASYGIEGFTQDHLAAFKKYGIKKVLIAYDRDDAGERAAAKLAPILCARGFECFRVEFPHGQDANDFARAVSDPADALGALLRGAAWLCKNCATAPPAQARADSAPSVLPAPATKEKDESIPLAAPEAAAPIEALTPAPPDPAASDMHPCGPPEALAEPEAAAIPAGNDHLLDEAFDGRAWRIRDLEKNTSYSVLKLNVSVSCGNRYHMHTFDLANANLRAAFLKAAAVEMSLPENVLKDDLRKLLLKLEVMRDALIQKKLAPKDAPPPMTDADRDEALAFLKSPDLLAQIARDFESIGMVGETTNLLAGYIAATSRKLDAPLHLLVQSMTAAGKTAVMNAILSLMPPEDVVDFSAMTGQALFYLDDVDLRHKILAIAEEEGAAKAGYSIKLFMSDGKLVIAATIKDPQTGNLIARRKERPGPASVFMTTTKLDIAEELMNRMLIETVNEDRDQTKRIHDMQRQSHTLAGLVRLAEREAILRRHRNAQRLLRPLPVINPYADQLTFNDTCIRTRRDHPKYLTLILSITLLNQYQRPLRPVKIGGKTVQVIESTPEDIAAANKLADEILGRSLDEMPAPTRRLLLILDDLVTRRAAEQNVPRENVRFTRRDVRDYAGMSPTQVKDHMKKLDDLEYVLIHRGARGISFEYELLYDGQGKDGRKFCPGLIDVTTLKTPEPFNYDANLAVENSHLAAEKPNLAVSKRPQNGGFAAGSRKPNFGAILTASKASRALMQNWAKTHILGNGRRRSTVSS